MDDWIARCAARVQQLGPEIWDEFARDIAIDLRSAWPALDPAEAADAFLRPEGRHGPGVGVERS